MPDEIIATHYKDIGIRLALGAESSHIRNRVVFQGLRPALAGVIWGLAAAFGLTRLITSFLFGVKPWDPLVFFMVPVILVGVALVAVWLPASARVGSIPSTRCGTNSFRQTGNHLRDPAVAYRSCVVALRLVMPKAGLEPRSCADYRRRRGGLSVSGFVLRFYQASRRS